MLNRLALFLGWSEVQVLSLSLLSLRELVRESPKLVHELTLLIRANGRL